MKQDYSHIIILVDRSGSMSDVASKMSEAVNGIILSNQEIPGKCTLTLAEFDDRYNLLYDFVDLNDSKIKYKLEPRGMTALVDAVCETIDAVGSKLSEMEEHERPSKVMMFVITDGMENNSRRKKSDARERIAHQTEKYSWLFSYIGADHDVFDQANDLGFRSGHTVRFMKADVSVDNMDEILSAKTKSLRVASAEEFCLFASGDTELYNQADREKLEEV